MTSLSAKFDGNDSQLGFALRAGLVVDQDCPMLKKLLESRPRSFLTVELHPTDRESRKKGGKVRLWSAHGQAALSYAQRRRWEGGSGGSRGRRQKNPGATDGRRIQQPNNGLKLVLSSDVKFC